MRTIQEMGKSGCSKLHQLDSRGCGWGGELSGPCARPSADPRKSTSSPIPNCSAAGTNSIHSLAKEKPKSRSKDVGAGRATHLSSNPCSARNHEPGQVSKRRSFLDRMGIMTPNLGRGPKGQTRELGDNNLPRWAILGPPRLSLLFPCDSRSFLHR